VLKIQLKEKKLENYIKRLEKKSDRGLQEFFGTGDYDLESVNSKKHYPNFY